MLTRIIKMKKFYAWIRILITIVICILASRMLFWNIKAGIAEASSIEKQTDVVQANKEEPASQVLPAFFIRKAIAAIEVKDKQEGKVSQNLNPFTFAIQKFIRLDYKDPKTLFKAEIPLLKELDDDLAENDKIVNAKEKLNSINRQHDRDIINTADKNKEEGNAQIAQGKDLESARDETINQIDIVSSPAKMPQKLDLDKSKPIIFIYHTHATESYLPEENGNFHSLERKYTVRAVGDELADQLNKKGYKVIHDDTVHDYPSYQQSYVRSLQTLQSNLKKTPTLKIIFDMHRDAAPKVNGMPKKSYVTINNEKVAKFSIVVGTGNPNADALQVFAEYIKAKSDEKYPGLAKGVIRKPYKFNQYNSNYYALLEMGDTANHIDESLRTAKYLAEILESVIEDLKK